MAIQTDLSLIKRKRFQGVAIVVKFSQDQLVKTSDKRTRGVAIVLKWNKNDTTSCEIKVIAKNVTIYKITELKLT